MYGKRIKAPGRKICFIHPTEVANMAQIFLASHKKNPFIFLTKSRASLQKAALFGTLLQ
jgi:hypothetical protein